MSAAVAQQVTNATEGVSLEVKKAPKVRAAGKYVPRRRGGGIWLGMCVVSARGRKGRVGLALEGVPKN